MIAADVVRPEVVALSAGQHDLIQYAMTVAGLALFAQFLWTWRSTGEVGARYRTAAHASLAIAAVAALSYAYLVLKFDQGYTYADGTYFPNAEALNTLTPRYMDWSVTVPLLMVEFLAVSGLVGARARSMRAALVAAAFLMIFTGYLGATVDGAGTDQTELFVWGLVSTAFYAALYVLLIRVLRSSKGSMSAQAYASYRNAAIVLLSVWGWYPIAYAIHNWLPGAGWTTTIQVGFSFADIAAKVGFGVLIHKVAKLRTAEDVHAGEQTHPEDVWISSVKESEGVQPLLKGVVLTGSGEGARPLTGPGGTADAAEGGARTADVTSTERTRHREQPDRP
ncbi:bacteriorhodopsin [Kineococcus auxinigenes]|uniref:bacteriorhodopsin n=1 Tax=unclassified Kineococcus TaxID=2621656 RepID=UPI003D7E26EF